MKVKIQAGAELDTVSPAELREEMRQFKESWFSEIAKGDKYKRIMANTISDSNQDFSIGGSAAVGAYLGPAEGFVWSVKRLYLYPLDATTQDVFLGINDSSVGSRVRRFDTSYLDFTTESLVLNPGETLIVYSENATASTSYTVTGQVREVPTTLVWRL